MDLERSNENLEKEDVDRKHRGAETLDTLLDHVEKGDERRLKIHEMGAGELDVLLDQVEKGKDKILILKGMGAEKLGNLLN